MNGFNLYQYLLGFYPRYGKYLFKGFCFETWKVKPNGLYAFEFRNQNTRRQIPADWIMDGRDAMNQRIPVDRYWFAYHFNKPSFNDTRAVVAMWLLNNHP